MESKIMIARRVLALASLAALAVYVMAKPINAGAHLLPSVMGAAADDGEDEPSEPGTAEPGEGEPRLHAPDAPSEDGTPRAEPEDPGVDGCIFQKRPLELII